MKTIYLDPDYRCHVTDDGTRKAVETEFFDGKCDAFIEGYRYIPAGETWTRADGVVFRGQMAAPWQDGTILEAYQAQYAAMLPEIEDMKNALNMLGVTADG